MSPRPRIADPITLSRLVSMGIVADLSAADPIDPKGEWSARYRHWGSSGFEDRSDEYGFLCLRRKTAEGPSFILDITQVTYDGPEREHRLSAVVTCAQDDTATPLAWEVGSDFVDGNGDRITELSTRSVGLRTDGGVEVRQGEVTSAARIQGAVTCEWSLLEAVQRLPFRRSTPVEFTLLEGLGVPKRGHRLSYRGPCELGGPDGGVTVHVYEHVGRGILPFEYWVDRNHRLLAAITGGRAWILEDILAEEWKDGRMRGQGEERLHQASHASGVENRTPKRLPLPRGERVGVRGRPNILFVLTDQQHADTIHAGGCPDVDTPALDRLCREGVRFEQSYCTHPVCSPSRSSLFTGRMPSETGVWLNGLPGGGIREDIPNVGQWFSSHTDYDTVYAGKWHVPYCHTYEIDGFRVPCSGLDHKGDVSDTLVSRGCESYLRNRNDDRPFLLVASLIQPHDICQWLHINQNSHADLRYAGIEDELPELPENFEYDPQEPGPVSWLRGIQQPAAGKWEELQWRYYLWHYYRHVEMVDAEIGRILSALDDTGQADNTLVVFTSDHGEGMAHHQLVRKDFFYDEAARVPMVLRPPGGISAGAVVTDRLASGLDVVPTFCDYAGIASPPGICGLSLRPLVADHSVSWRRFVVSESSAGGQSSRDPKSTSRMVRSTGYKYIRYNNDGSEQFFDMRKDPGEMVNLAANEAQAGVIEEHRAMLREWESGLDQAPEARELRTIWAGV